MVLRWGSRVAVPAAGGIARAVAGGVRQRLATVAALRPIPRARLYATSANGFAPRWRQWLSQQWQRFETANLAHPLLVRGAAGIVLYGIGDIQPALSVRFTPCIYMSYLTGRGCVSQVTSAPS